MSAAGRVIGDVLADGVLVHWKSAELSFLDIGMQRGYGCFEALRSYGGTVFRSAEHLDRLEASAQRLHLPLPDREALEAWVADRGRAGGDCIVRVLATGGLDPANPGDNSRVFVYAEPLPASSGPIRVLPVAAPWHSDGVMSELTGAKTLSYGPNLAASLAAQRAGYDDALLIGRSGSVLEGPTYGFAWVIDGVIETPSLDLGILASITRAALVEIAADLGVQLDTGRYRLDRVVAADEVCALSTVKEVTPVVAVGEKPMAPGPVTERLADAFRALVAAETAAK